LWLRLALADREVIYYVIIREYNITEINRKTENNVGSDGYKY